MIKQKKIKSKLDTNCIFFLEKKKKNKKITLRAASEIQEIKGLERVESVIVKNRFLDKIDEYKCQGVFVEIGVKPNSDFVKNLVEINKNGEIVVDNKCRTNIEGVFAAGDVTDVPYKQIVIAAGEGAKAALSVYEYLIHNCWNNC